MEEVVIRGVTLQKQESKITVRHLADKPGVAAVMFRKLADANINVDMIIQNMSADGHTDISFTVATTDRSKAEEVIRASLAELGGESVVIDDDIAKLSVVGIGMRSHAGVAAAMFDALAKAGINIQMISTSEIKISCVIGMEKAEEAVRVLHREFKLGEGA